MNSKSTHQSMMLMLLALGLTSCSSRDATPTAAELAWRQQMREATAATESKSLEETIEAIRKYLDDGNLIAAQKELRPLVNTNASHPDVVVLAARCEAADGDKAVAAKMLMENAKADQETIFKSLFLASKWYLDINEFELAEIPLKRVLELSSEVPS